jgi:intracellular sulfur oxidation DsrE/DsrF family protein
MWLGMPDQLKSLIYQSQTYIMNPINRPYCFMFVLLLAFQSVIIAQTTTQSRGNQRKELLTKAQDKLLYPYLKGDIFSGILPVDNVTDLADYSQTYKLLFDFADGNSEDLKKGNINPGIQEVIRILNLHRAAGVPENRMEIAVIIHGPGTSTFLNNDEFKKMFGIDNQNLELVKQLQAKGVKFSVCGQTLGLRGWELEKLVTGVRKAYSARTVLSTYQSKGFVVYPIEMD